MDFCEIRLTTSPIVRPPESETCDAGAIVDFWGVVRPFESGRSIDGIDYEYHERMAERELHRIIEESAIDLLGCRLIHRVGFVPSREASLFLRVATPHRVAAYRLSQQIVGQLKSRVPIWKRPRFSESTEPVSLAQ